MDWKMILASDQEYPMTVQKSFHVSKAWVQDISCYFVIKVMLYYDNRDYQLCKFGEKHNSQASLDLNLQKGTKVCFSLKRETQTSGLAYHVQLSGYFLPDEEPQPIDNSFKIETIVLAMENKIIELLTAVLNQKVSSEDEKNKLEKKTSLELGVEVGDNSDGTDDDDDNEEVEDKGKVEMKQQQKTNEQKDQQQTQKLGIEHDKEKLINGNDVDQDVSEEQSKKNEVEQQQHQKNAQQVQNEMVTEEIVQIEDVTVGNGALARSGKFFSVHYAGRSMDDKKFEAPIPGDGDECRLRKIEVIKGWLVLPE